MKHTEAIEFIKQRGGRVTAAELAATRAISIAEAGKVLAELAAAGVCRALSEEGSSGRAGGLSAARERELLGMTNTGRAMLESAGDPQSWQGGTFVLNDDEAPDLSKDDEADTHYERLSVRVGRRLDRLGETCAPKNGMAMPEEQHKFIERATRGDLRKTIIRAAYAKLQHTSTDREIQEGLIGAMGKLSRDVPPTLVERVQAQLSATLKK